MLVRPAAARLFGSGTAIGPAPDLGTGFGGGTTIGIDKKSFDGRMFC